MTDIDNDPLLQRAIGELRRLPAVDADAVSRVVVAAATARHAPVDEPRLLDASRSRRRATLLRIAGVGVAAAAVGFLARGLMPARAVPSPMSIAATAAANPQPNEPIRPVSNAGEATLVPHQFVLRNDAARKISVVGDFNTWNPRSAPMTRAADGVWSAVIAVPPGRHVYGFMIDDSLFTLDPRAATVRDPDLGSNGSVVLVGRP
jgi:Carbohydrate-binding module 48 (Isoamylase N-terminal domain)